MLDDGLFINHPGCVKITDVHYNIIKDALVEWKKKCNKEPGFPKEIFGVNGRVLEDEDKYCPILARLIWLEFWFDWSLKNCKYPAIANS